MRISLFRTEKPRQFSYQNRYHDPEREERERRHKRYNTKKEDLKYDKDEFRQELKHRWSLQRESNLPFNQRISSVKRIILTIVILIIVLALLYLLANVVYNYSV